jgi:hypothetical protein
VGYLPTPAEIVNFWRSRRTERHRKMSDYLEAVAAEATALADRWNSLASDLERELGKPQLAGSEVVQQLAMLGTIAHPNPEYDKIVLHYRTLSTVIGGLVSEEIHTEAANALGAIIKARTELKDLLVSACKLLQSDKTLPSDTVEQVRMALAALHQEAAALDVLAKAYKAKT